MQDYITYDFNLQKHHCQNHVAPMLQIMNEQNDAVVLHLRGTNFSSVLP